MCSATWNRFPIRNLRLILCLSHIREQLLEFLNYKGFHQYLFILTSAITENRLTFLFRKKGKFGIIWKLSFSWFRASTFIKTLQVWQQFLKFYFERKIRRCQFSSQNFISEKNYGFYQASCGRPFWQNSVSFQIFLIRLIISNTEK